MFRNKVISLFVAPLAILLSSCAPGSPSTLPPGMTLVPDTDIPPPAVTFMPGAITQTAIPATSTPVPGVATLPVGYETTSTPIPMVIDPSAQTLYQSPALGFQFSYPAAWYLQEASGGVTITSFNPSNPPHKLEWTDQTTSMQFGFMVLVTPPVSFDAWVESAKQVALANQLSVYAEERFLIANQSAAHLILVSGSGGIIHQVLTSLSGRYLEINIEGNYNLAKAVLDSIQPLPLGGLKPPDSDMPAAGICGEAHGDPISIVLGLSPDGIPLAGRCITITPAQRIKLINQSSGPFNMIFAKYQINLPIGGEMLLDEPVGQYLASGVHFLPMGPELWVKAAASVTPVVTAPPPIVLYSNPVVGYRLGLPEDWHIDENGMTNSVNKEVIFSPQYAEPFVTYLSISLDFRTLDQIIAAYAQNAPNVVREDGNFYGNPGIKFTVTNGRNEYFIPYGGQIFLIATDKPNDGIVQSILMTIQFTTPAVTFEVMMADNGRTLNMKVGESLRLNLDSGYDWSVSVNNTTVIDGLQGIYHARASGTASLTAFGDPKCLSFTPPCLTPSIMLTITVIVQ